MADSYETATIQLAVTMVAKSSAFQALVDVDSEADARGYIIEVWGGDPSRNDVAEGTAIASDGSSVITLTGAHALVDPVDFPVDTLESLRYERREGTIRVAIIVPREGASPPAQWRNFCNTMGNIRKDIMAASGIVTGATDVIASLDSIFSGWEPQEVDEGYSGNDIGYIDLAWRAV